MELLQHTSFYLFVGVTLPGSEDRHLLPSTSVVNIVNNYISRIVLIQRAFRASFCIKKCAIHLIVRKWTRTLEQQRRLKLRRELHESGVRVFFEENCV